MEPAKSQVPRVDPSSDLHSCRIPLRMLSYTVFTNAPWIPVSALALNCVPKWAEKGKESQTREIQDASTWPQDGPRELVATSGRPGGSASLRRGKGEGDFTPVGEVRFPKSDAN